MDFLRLKLGVISTAKTAHNQGANNERKKLFCETFSCSLEALGNW